MKSRDDLFSVLNLGWESSRQAWRILAADDPFSPAAIGTTGRDLDHLAYDLRRLGFGKPARLAYSIAFVLNGLANGTLAYDRELAEKTTQIVSVLAEMLLELEATSQITVNEPVEVVNVLKVRWGLTLAADEAAASPIPAPHFHAHHAMATTTEAQSELMGLTDDLVCASESLLKRATHDEGFAYATALSRIHHLGMAIRDRVTQSAGRVPRGLLAFAPATSDVGDAEPAVHETSAEESSMELSQLTVREESSEVQADRTSQILLIDESPFFRMLLTSAITAAGFEIKTLPTFLDAQETIDQELFDVIICDETVLTRKLNSEDEWLRSHMTSANSLLALSNDPDSTLDIPDCQQISRKEISSLLSHLKLILGPGNPSSLISAA